MDRTLKNAALYVNYVLFGTPLEATYGEHLGQLREIKKKKYDPEDVMRFAGRWKFNIRSSCSSSGKTREGAQQ
jgi:hypothetical protein